MIKILKNQKGITLITLIITIVILVILTAAMATNSYISLNISKLTRLQNDIEILNDRIASYYVKNGKLPIYKEENTNFQLSKSSLINQFEDLALSDGDVYYTIDLTALEINLQTLNYGAGYQSPDSYDRYIVNEETHVVYYLKGINYEGEEYHTVGKNI